MSRWILFPASPVAVAVADRRKVCVCHQRNHGRGQENKEGKIWRGGTDNADRDEMQRRRPVAAAEEIVHNQGEVVNLLNTDLRDECKPAPSAERLKNFVRENYTLERMMPISR